MCIISLTLHPISLLTWRAARDCVQVSALSGTTLLRSTATVNLFLPCLRGDVEGADGEEEGFRREEAASRCRLSHGHWGLERHKARLLCCRFLLHEFVLWRSYRLMLQYDWLQINNEIIGTHYISGALFRRQWQCYLSYVLNMIPYFNLWKGEPIRRRWNCLHFPWARNRRRDTGLEQKQALFVDFTNKVLRLLIGKYTNWTF